MQLFSSFKNQYRENFIPVITKNEETAFKLVGNAYFFEDKMFGMISREDSLIYGMLTKTINNTEIETAQGADVRILKNHKSILHTWNEMRKPHIVVNIKVVFTLLDSSYMEPLHLVHKK